MNMKPKRTPSLSVNSLIKKGISVPQNAVRIIRGRLGGKWMERLGGFVLDDVWMIAAEPGSITYRLQGDGVARTLELVRFARQHRCQLLQVQRDGASIYLEIPATFLKKAGFAPDEMLLALYEPGLLKLQRPDLS